MGDIMHGVIPPDLVRPLCGLPQVSWTVSSSPTVRFSRKRSFRMLENHENEGPLSGNVENRSLVRRAVKSFRDSEVPLASIGAAMPPRIAGTDLSDHSSFWQFGYPGALVTDTNYLRTAHYHRATDSPEKLNYEVLAVAVDGLAVVIADLAGSDTASTD